MNQGKLVFSQIMDHVPMTTFRRCVAKHRGDHKIKDFSCFDQFLAMSFAQLTCRESLRDIEVDLRIKAKRLYHLGFRCQTISRNTLSNANAIRSWQIYADFEQNLIGIARPLYAQDPLAIDLDAAVYAFDATTIDLCLSVYPWAPFRTTKAAVKMHTLLDLHGNIPSFIHITDGKTHEVNILDQLIIEARAFYLMDRGYLDFARLYKIHQSQALIVIRNNQYQISTQILATSGQREHQCHQRSTWSSAFVHCEKTLSRHHRVRHCQRRQREKTQLLNQQHDTQARAHCRPLLPKMTSEMVLQMDQAALTNQEI